MHRLIAIVALLFACAVAAKDAAPTAENPAVEARMLALANELRCLVCQNQTIAESHAGLAEDLRQQMREMIARGDTDRQIMDFMTARYGDFVLYRPPLKEKTMLLWFGPALLVAIGLAALFVILRRRSKLAADRFDPDDDATAQDGGTR